MVFLGGWSFVTCEGWWGRGLCPFRESLKDFQTDPPIHRSLLEMTSCCAHSEWDVPPVCHGNYKYPGYKSCRSSPQTFSTVGVYYFMAVIFNFISCLLLLCPTFMTFIKMTPQVMLHCLKMTPSKMATPSSQVINGQPLRSITQSTPDNSNLQGK